MKCSITTSITNHSCDTDRGKFYRLFCAIIKRKPYVVQVMCKLLSSSVNYLISPGITGNMDLLGLIKILFLSLFPSFFGSLVCFFFLFSFSFITYVYVRCLSPRRKKKKRER